MRAYLEDKESETATQELLDIPGFIESFEKGQDLRNRHIFLVGCCDTLIHFERSYMAIRVRHQPSVMTIA